MHMPRALHGPTHRLTQRRQKPQRRLRQMPPFELRHRQRLVRKGPLLEHARRDAIPIACHQRADLDPKRHRERTARQRAMMQKLPGVTIPA